MSTGTAAHYPPASPTAAQPVAALQTLLLGTLLAVTLFTVDINLMGGGDADISLNPQVAFKLALWTLGAALAFAHLKKLLHVFAFPGPLLLIATLGLAVLSTSYSLNPDLTLGSCYGVICTALFTALTMHAFPERAFSALLVGTNVVLILSCWLAHFALPGVSRLEYLNAAGEVSVRLGGLIHPNALGRTAAIALGIGLLMFRQRQLGGPGMIMLTAISLPTLFATQSRTAVLGLVAGLLAVFLRKVSPVSLAVLVALVAIGGSAAVAMLLNNPEVGATMLAKLARSGDAEEFYTLTGRIVIWSFAWDQIQLAPLLGYGFGAARNVFAAGLGPNQWIAGHTHNGILEVLISLGFVGGILVVATLVRQLYLYLRQPCDIPDFLLLYTIVTGFLTAGPYAGVPSRLYLFFVVSLLWRPLFRAQGMTEHSVEPTRRKTPVT